MLLKGKFAIITGAASPRGIGKATVHRLTENGAKVAILVLDAEATPLGAADRAQGSS